MLTHAQIDSHSCGQHRCSEISHKLSKPPPGLRCVLRRVDAQKTFNELTAPRVLMLIKGSPWAGMENMMDYYTNNS